MAMLSRWYALFLGLLLLVLGVAGLVAPRVLGFGTGTLVTTSLIWLVTAIVALWFGFGVRNAMNLRWFAGIVGGLYFLWGIIQLISSGAAMGVASATLLASLSGLMILLGAIGLAAALTPATWMERRPEVMPGPA
ncbi:MAG: hypothetical protein ACYDBB_00375 [Armatimonadota bacterium]